MTDYRKKGPDIPFSLFHSIGQSLLFYSIILTKSFLLLPIGSGKSLFPCWKRLLEIIYIVPRLHTVLPNQGEE